MAELEYEFTESGLSDLRSDMEALAQETEDVGDTADDTASDLEDMADTDAAGDIPDDMEEARGEVEQLGEEAEASADQLEESFEGSASEVRSQLEGIGDQLMQIDEQDISIDASGGDLLAEGGSVIADALASGAGVGGALQLSSVDLSGVENLKGALTEAVREAGVLEEELEVATQHAEELQKVDASSLERYGAEADDTAQSLLEATQHMDELEQGGDGPAKIGNVGNIPTKLTDLGIDDLKGSLDDIGVDDLGNQLDNLDFEGLTDSMGEAAEEAAGLGGSFGGLAGKGKLLLTTLGPVRGTIIGLTAAVSTLTPKFGRLSRELQTAAANASELPSEIQQIANAQELLTGRADPDQVGEVFKEFKLRMREAQEGAQEAKEGFQRLGISMDTLAEKSPDEAFELVLERLRQTSEEQRALTREQVLGGEAAEQFALMTSLSADELERLNDAAAENVFSDDEIAKMAAMGRELDSIGQRFEKMGGELLLTFEPVIQTILKGFDELLGLINTVFSTLAEGVQWIADLIEQTRVFTEGDLEFNFQGGEGTDSLVPEEGTEESGSSRLGQIMNGLAKRTGRIRQRFQKGLIDKQKMLRQIVSARESAFQQLQTLGQEMPGLVSDKLLSHLASGIKEMRRRLDKMGDEAAPDAPVESLQPAEQQTLPTGEPTQDLQLEPMGGGLSSLMGAAEGADSVGEINSLIQATREQFDTLNNTEARDFIGRLQKAKAEMQEAQTEAAAIGQAMSQSIARSADRVFQSIGNAVSDAIFSGGGQSVAQAKLNLFNAQDQVRSLRESLRQGQLSYRKFALRMQVQQSKIQKRQEQLNDTMQSGFADAAESMLSAFKKIAKQLIAQITAVVAKMAVLKAITSAFSIGSGGFLGGVISNLGGSAFLDSGASGGMVKSSGLAEIHEDEQIMTADTVAALEGLLKPSTPSVQPAAVGGGGMNVTVNVQGETRTDGRDLKTTYDTTSRIQRRKGHSSR